MAHRNNDNQLDAVMELLIENGFESFADVLRILLNEALKIERGHALGAGLYERSDQRRGYANGYKPKAIDTRIGKLNVDVPQVRGDVNFYPSALERGCRSGVGPVNHLTRPSKLLAVETMAISSDTLPVSAFWGRALAASLAVIWKPESSASSLTRHAGEGLLHLYIFIDQTVPLLADGNQCEALLSSSLVAGVKCVCRAAFVNV